MGRLRHTVEDEQIEKGLETGGAIRLTITDQMMGRKASALGADYPDALERACAKLGISLENIEDEFEED